MSNESRKSRRGLPKGRDFQGEFAWRTSSQINGTRAQLQAAINVAFAIDAEAASIDLSVAKNLIEICRQAAQMERNEQDERAKSQ